MKVHDLKDRVFARLRVLSYHGHSNCGKRTWLCQCECGAETVVMGQDLITGNTKSCGCWLSDSARINGRASKGPPMKHGHAQGSVEYRAWQSMRARTSPGTTGSQRRWYYDRGIRCCERWASFENFIADMGPHPGQGYSLDRINNDGNYEPSNCRWATWVQQANNRRAPRRRTA